MEEQVVKYRVDGNVGFVTLNRPDKLNSIDQAMREQAVRVLMLADDDDSTSVIVLSGEGRSFCAGYDISGGGDPAAEADALKWHKKLSGSLHLEMLPWRLRKPVIASVRGHAIGAGCQLAMFCDLTIAADDAKFGEPEIRFSNSGPAFVMPWIIGYKKARELIYFGDLIDAPSALELGMINKVVPATDLEAETLRYARRLAQVGPEALKATKLAINRVADASGFSTGMQAGVDTIAPLYAAETEVGVQFKEITAKEGLRAALKWRKRHFD